MTYAERLIERYATGTADDEYWNASPMKRITILIEEAMEAQREACWKNYIDEMSSGMPARDNFQNSNLHRIAKEAILNAKVK